MRIGPGAALNDVLELPDGLVDDRQVDHGGREDPVLEIEGPVLVHPLIEGVYHYRRGLRVVGEPLLEQAGQGGPHHRPVHLLLVHYDDPLLGIEEARWRLDVARYRSQPGVRLLGAPYVETTGTNRVLRRRILEPELHLLAPWRCHLVEGWVRDVLADHTSKSDLRPTIHLHVLDEAFVLPGQVLGERVRRLVHVVVCIEHWVVEDVGHVVSLRSHDSSITGRIYSHLLIRETTSH